MNIIETLQIGIEREWRKLPVNEKIRPAYHLAVAQVDESILLFGGTTYSGLVMQKFSEEGELLEDLSYFSGIPDSMLIKPFAVQLGTVSVLEEKHQKNLRLV